jgi:hypothetical protein
MDISKYQKDHFVIMEQLRLLASMSTKPLEYLQEIPPLLSSASAKLKVHVVTEEATVYYGLSILSDEKITNLSGRMYDEIMTLASKWDDYVNKWHSPERIKASPQSFTIETEEITHKIRERIAAEEEYLYPLAKEHL